MKRLSFKKFHLQLLRRPQVSKRERLTIWLLCSCILGGSYLNSFEFFQVLITKML